MNVPTTSVPGLLSPQEVSVHTDTRELLAHAKRDARKRGFQDWLICDIDAHHVETVSWKEIVTYIEDPVIREQAWMVGFVLRELTREGLIYLQDEASQLVAHLLGAQPGVWRVPVPQHLPHSSSPLGNTCVGKLLDARCGRCLIAPHGRLRRQSASVACDESPTQSASRPPGPSRSGRG